MEADPAMARAVVDTMNPYAFNLIIAPDLKSRDTSFKGKKAK